MRDDVITSRRLEEEAKQSESQDAKEKEDSAAESEASEATFQNETAVLLDEASNTTSFNATSVRTRPPVDPMQAAAMLFNDGDLDRLHASLSDTQKNSSSDAQPPHWYEPYPTTLSLILLLHVIFFYQWNKRKTKQQALVSYRQLVKQKQYYRGVVAFLSHPPVEARAPSRDTASSPSLAIEMGNASTEYRGTSVLRRIYDVLQPVIKGHLSGLPLLAYNSHILWSVRALEPLCPSSWYYAHMLLVLGCVAMAIELRMTHNMLLFNRASIGFGDLVAQRRAVLNRTIGTLTPVTAALLLLYRTALPHISLLVFPLAPFPFLLPPWFSHVTCAFLLTGLSWRLYPIRPVVYGTASAFLWNVGVTRFLANDYWSFCLILWIVLGCLISFRGSASLEGWVPCIDYVAWDSRGVIQSRDNATTARLGSQHGHDYVEDDDDDHDEQEADTSSAAHDDPERQPLAPIHGRVPMVNMDDDDDDDDDAAIEMPSRRSSAPLTRQRRGGSSFLESASDSQR